MTDTGGGQPRKEFSGSLPNPPIPVSRPPSGTKVCTTCGERPLTDFSPDKRASDGRLSRCRACYRIYNRARYRRPEVKAAKAEYAREYLKRPEVKNRLSQPAAKARLAKNRRNYKKRPGWRERNKVWQARYREKCGDQIRARGRTPEARAIARERVNFKYSNDPKFRAALLSRQARYNARKRAAQ